MFEAIKKIKNFGYKPDTVFDLGAHHGMWTQECLNIWDDAKYFLFEPIEYNELNRFRYNTLKFKVNNVILNEENKDVEWFEMRNTGDSIFREKSKHFIDCKPLIKPSYTLDSQIDNIDFSNMKNIFIKIDCQGSEIPILKGSSNILTKTDFILMEIPLFGQYNENVPSFKEHINYMEEIEFTIYDIIEVHYVNGFSMQVDVIFINKNHSFNNLVKNKML
jgi:FkbM family methyltransferase